MNFLKLNSEIIRVDGYGTITGLVLCENFSNVFIRLSITLV